MYPSFIHLILYHSRDEQVCDYAKSKLNDLKLEHMHAYEAVITMRVARMVTREKKSILAELCEEGLISGDFSKKVVEYLDRRLVNLMHFHAIDNVTRERDYQDSELAKHAHDEVINGNGHEMFDLSPESSRAGSPVGFINGKGDHDEIKRHSLHKKGSSVQLLHGRAIIRPHSVKAPDLLEELEEQDPAHKDFHQSSVYFEDEKTGLRTPRHKLKGKKGDKTRSIARVDHLTKTISNPGDNRTFPQHGYPTRHAGHLGALLQYGSHNIGLHSNSHSNSTVNVSSDPLENLLGDVPVPPRTRRCSDSIVIDSRRMLASPLSPLLSMDSNESTESDDNDKALYLSDIITENEDQLKTSKNTKVSFQPVNGDGAYGISVAQQDADSDGTLTDSGSDSESPIM